MIRKKLKGTLSNFQIKKNNLIRYALVHIFSGLHLSGSPQVFRFHDVQYRFPSLAYRSRSWLNSTFAPTPGNPVRHRGGVNTILLSSIAFSSPQQIPSPFLLYLPLQTFSFLSILSVSLNALVLQVPGTGKSFFK